MKIITLLIIPLLKINLSMLTRRRKLLDDLKGRTGYSHLKERALDRTMWTARFGRDFGPVVRRTATKWINGTNMSAWHAKAAWTASWAWHGSVITQSQSRLAFIKPQPGSMTSLNYGANMDYSITHSRMHGSWKPAPYATCRHAGFGSKH